MSRIPEKIPESCSECTHFERAGGAGSFVGYCSFYQRDTSVDWSCYALEAFPEDAAEVQRVTRALIPKEREAQVVSSAPMPGASVFNAIGVLAWVVLVLNMIAAVIVWVTAITASSALGVSLDPVSIGLGVYLALQGILFALFCRGFYWIGTMVAEIRRDQRDGGAP